MGKIGYSISEAASSVGASKTEISLAISTRELAAHKVEGRCVILKDDICAWIRTKPSFLGAID